MIPHGHIRSALRKLWLWSPTRRDAIRRQKTFSGRCMCQGCGMVIPTKMAQVDHIVPVGPTPGSRNGKGVTWDEFMRRLFCPVTGLQVLCLPCHDKKTYSGKAS